MPSGKHAGKMLILLSLANVITNKISTEESKRAKFCVNSSVVTTAVCGHCGHRLKH